MKIDMRSADFRGGEVRTGLLILVLFVVRGLLVDVMGPVDGLTAIWIVGGVVLVDGVFLGTALRREHRR